MRFGIGNNGKSIRWSAVIRASLNISDYSISKDPWNIEYGFDDNLYNKELYYTITLDTKDVYEKDEETYYKQTLYLNTSRDTYRRFGRLIIELGVCQELWQVFHNS